MVGRGVTGGMARKNLHRQSGNSLWGTELKEQKKLRHCLPVCERRGGGAAGFQCDLLLLPGDRS